VKILQGDKNINEAELRFFLAGPTGEIKIKANPTTWISENIWPDVYRQLYCMSTTINNMKGIDEFFLEKCEDFKPMFDSPNAHTEKYPEPW
jgi:dynein heavy chain